MTAFFEFQLKAGGVLALGVLIYILFLSRDTSFQRNRVWLLACLFVPWIVPLMAMPVRLKELVFGKALPIKQFVVANYVAKPVSVPVVQSKTFEWETMLMTAFVLIAVVLLVRLAIGCFSVMKLRHHSIKSNYKGLRLRLFKNVTIVPFSFFRTIYAPKEIEEQKDYQLILEHESTHCKQLHSIDIILANLVLLFQWWNPFAWWLQKLIAQNHEYCVDSSMLKKVSDPGRYQYMLVNLLLGNSSLQLVNSFNGSFTKKRIVMMNKDRSNHILNKLKFVPAIMLLVVGVSAFTNPDKTLVSEGSVPLSMSEVIKALPITVTNEAKVIADEPSEDGDSIVVVGKAVKNPKSSVIVSDEVAKVVWSEDSFNIMSVNQSGGKPLVIINGEEKSMEDIKSIDPSVIDKISTLSNETATEAYGEKGKDGVVIIRFKDQVSENDMTSSNKLVVMRADKPGESATDTEEVKVVGYGKMKDVDVSSSNKLVVMRADKPGESAPDSEEVKVIGYGKMKDAEVNEEVDKENKFTFSANDSVIANDGGFVLYGAPKLDNIDDVLILVDNKKSTLKQMNALDPNLIKSVTVLKNEAAIKAYGKKGKHGVIQVTLKK